MHSYVTHGLVDDTCIVDICARDIIDNRLNDICALGNLEPELTNDAVRDKYIHIYMLCFNHNRTCHCSSRR